MVDEFRELLDKCEQEGSFERLLARARNRWRRPVPICSNEAAAEAEGRPLFGGKLRDLSGISAYDNLSQTSRESYQQ
ncbi:MAG: hypothetical protein WC979_05760 [Candidatus Pacearchaeota archaeon]|jgi:hypothetical protein